jgi:hypothetical protein
MCVREVEGKKRGGGDRKAKKRTGKGGGNRDRWTD